MTDIYMPKLNLGYLEPVDLRNIWTDEAKDFTPWLAEPENLKRLGDVLDMDLELEGTEVSVGPYFADIVANEPNANQKVVIENQLEKTDHDHLGKVITYASGLGAKVMIWIARQVTEEHRRAIDFLNENSAPNMRFYAIEVQAVRIGNSPPAPLFKVIASPNEYAETARNDVNVSGTKAMYLELWNAFREYALQHGTFLKLRKPSTDYWYTVALGRNHFAVSLTVSLYYKRAGCELFIDGGQIAKAAFQLLQQQKAEIEAVTGPLDWQELPETQRCKLLVYRNGIDPADKNTWPDLFQWMKEKAELFHKTFAPRVKALPLEEGVAAAAAAGDEN